MAEEIEEEIRKKFNNIIFVEDTEIDNVYRILFYKKIKKIPVILQFLFYYNKLSTFDYNIDNLYKKILYLNEEEKRCF